MTYSVQRRIASGKPDYWDHATLLELAGQPVPKTKRILELNPGHAVLERLQEAFDADRASSEIEDYTRLLYDLALMSEGAAVPDPQRFSELVTRLMVK